MTFAPLPPLAALRRVARRGIAIGGVESGSLVLAMAGLLNGRRATTRWEDLEEFAARFPEIDVRSDRYVIDGARFTTGGASPALESRKSMPEIAAQTGFASAPAFPVAFVRASGKPARCQAAPTFRADRIAGLDKADWAR